mgnify:CR=1 FL=1
MKVGYKDLGTMPYKECWQLQQTLFEQRLEARRRGEKGADCGTILTVDHPPVYPLGKSGKQSQRVFTAGYSYGNSVAVVYHTVIVNCPSYKAEQSFHFIHMSNLSLSAYIVVKKNRQKIRKLAKGHGAIIRSLAYIRRLL